MVMMNYHAMSNIAIICGANQTTLSLHLINVPTNLRNIKENLKWAVVGTCRIPNTLTDFSPMIHGVVFIIQKFINGNIQTQSLSVECLRLLLLQVSEKSFLFREWGPYLEAKVIRAFKMGYRFLDRFFAFLLKAKVIIIIILEKILIILIIIHYL